MLDALKRLFEERGSATDAGAAGHDEHTLRVATAALLVEMSRADFEEDDEELPPTPSPAPHHATEVGAPPPSSAPNVRTRGLDLALTDQSFTVPSAEQDRSCCRAPL